MSSSPRASPRTRNRRNKSATGSEVGHDLGVTPPVPLQRAVARIRTGPIRVSRGRSLFGSQGAVFYLLGGVGPRLALSRVRRLDTNALNPPKCWLRFPRTMSATAPLEPEPCRPTPGSAPSALLMGIAGYGHTTGVRRDRGCGRRATARFVTPRRGTPGSGLLSANGSQRQRPGRSVVGCQFLRTAQSPSEWVPGTDPHTSRPRPAQRSCVVHVAGPDSR